MNKALKRNGAFHLGIAFLTSQLLVTATLRYFPTQYVLNGIMAIVRTLALSIFIFAFHGIAVESNKKRLKTASLILSVVILFSFVSTSVLQITLRNNFLSDVRIAIPGMIYGLALIYFGVIVLLENSIYAKKTKYVAILIIVQGLLMASWYLFAFSFIWQWVAFGGLVWLVHERKIKEKYGVPLH